jgi:acyl-CoA dehydrogenase
MFGHPGSNEAVIYLDGVVVPDDHLLGGVGDGFALAMEGVSLGRLYNCAKGVGLATWALQMALDYTQSRTAFSAPLSDHQGVAFPLAESAIDIHAARLMSVHCAQLLDAGLPARKELAMAKVAATEGGLRVVDRAMQVHGAIGFTNDLGLAEAWQMIRVVCVADGSAEILRRQIAARLYAGDVAL